MPPAPDNTSSSLSSPSIYTLLLCIAVVGFSALVIACLVVPIVRRRIYRRGSPSTLTSEEDVETGEALLGDDGAGQEDEPKELPEVPQARLWAGPWTMFKRKDGVEYALADGRDEMVQRGEGKQTAGQLHVEVTYFREVYRDKTPIHRRPRWSLVSKIFSRHSSTSTKRKSISTLATPIFQVASSSDQHIHLALPPRPSEDDAAYPIAGPSKDVIKADVPVEKTDRAVPTDAASSLSKNSSVTSYVTFAIPRTSSSRARGPRPRPPSIYSRPVVSQGDKAIDKQRALGASSDISDSGDASRWGKVSVQNSVNPPHGTPGSQELEGVGQVQSTMGQSEGRQPSPPGLPPPRSESSSSTSHVSFLPSSLQPSRRPTGGLTPPVPPTVRGLQLVTDPLPSGSEAVSEKTVSPSTPRALTTAFQSHNTPRTGTPSSTATTQLTRWPSVGTGTILLGSESSGSASGNVSQAIAANAVPTSLRAGTISSHSFSVGTLPAVPEASTPPIRRSRQDGDTLTSHGGATSNTRSGTTLEDSQGDLLRTLRVGGLDSIARQGPQVESRVVAMKPDAPQAVPSVLRPAHRSSSSSTVPSIPAGSTNRTHPSSVPGRPASLPSDQDAVAESPPARVHGITDTSPLRPTLNMPGARWAQIRDQVHPSLRPSATSTMPEVTKRTMSQPSHFLWSQQTFPLSIKALPPISTSKAKPQVRVHSNTVSSSYNVEAPLARANSVWAQSVLDIAATSQEAAPLCESPVQEESIGQGSNGKKGKKSKPLQWRVVNLTDEDLQSPIGHHKGSRSQDSTRSKPNWSDDGVSDGVVLSDPTSLARSASSPTKTRPHSSYHHHRKGSSSQDGPSTSSSLPPPARPNTPTKPAQRLVKRDESIALRPLPKSVIRASFSNPLQRNSLAMAPPLALSQRVRAESKERVVKEGVTGHALSDASTQALFTSTGAAPHLASRLSEPSAPLLPPPPHVAQESQPGRTKSPSLPPLVFPSLTVDLLGMDDAAL